MTADWRVVLERARALQRHHNNRVRSDAEQIRLTRSRLKKISLAAVDNLDLFERLAPTFKSDTEATQLFAAAIESARAQLELAGITLDGAVGETLDTRKHKVVEEARGAPDQAGRVLRIVQKGIVVDHQRIRPAAVIVALEGKRDD